MVTNNDNVANTTVHDGLDPNWQIKSTYNVSFKQVYTVQNSNPFPPSDTILKVRKSLTLAFRNATNHNSLGIGEESETEDSNRSIYSFCFQVFDSFGLIPWRMMQNRFKGNVACLNQVFELYFFYRK